MKIHLLFLGLAFPFLLAAENKPKSGWKEFTSKDGGFSVLLPAPPKEDKVPIKSPDGKPTTQYQFAVDGGNGAYLVSYQDNPNLVKADGEAADKALIAAQKTAQASVGGKLLAEKKIKLGGN